MLQTLFYTSMRGLMYFMGLAPQYYDRQMPGTTFTRMKLQCVCVYVFVKGKGPNDHRVSQEICNSLDQAFVGFFQATALFAI